jgi:type I restriction enzyme, R subunit
MNKVGQVERATQQRVVRFFEQSLGYEYLGDWTERTGANIETEWLEANLRRRDYPADQVRRAIDIFTTAAGNQTDNLYEVNQRVYGLLRYGVKFKLDVGEQAVTVYLIDWNNPAANHFAIAEEVTVHGKHSKRPDLVLYVNGIALGVVELKRSTVFVSEAIRQNIDNQQPGFIERFFTTVQVVMAGNDTQGLRYGTTGTPEKYYLQWNEEQRDDLTPHLLDNHLAHLCAKDRLLEIVYDFIMFDGGVKKICRPNQYFGVKAAQARLSEGEGGIIWHTQGSGKSLTMVWLSRWIRARYSDARILVITDRTELDEQIERVYQGVGEDIKRTRSGAQLIDWLGATRPLVMCSLVHKFPGQDDRNADAFVQELTAHIPRDFKPFGRFFVFVDECHRTQSGKLHKGMKLLLPEATFVGFTGTPLLKTDKERRTSIETFGTYIHTYKYNDAVADGVVLDLQYEARDIDQHLDSPDKVDRWFEAKTAGLTDFAAAQLKQRWGTMRNVLSARRRLERIVEDIIFDMEMQPRLASKRGNAMLVAGSIYEACKLYKLFVDSGFRECAIVTSYDPQISDVKGESTGDGDTETIEKYEIYQQMLAGRSAEDFEREVKKQFVESPAQMRLLIVVDKLLTGFDAPAATYLYIDKQMRDHGLFQAICRVNRLDGDDKEYGHIVDYKDLFKSLEQSIQDYTSEAFDGFDRVDVEGLLQHHLNKARERLEAAREKIKALCEPVEPPHDTSAYMRYFCGGTSDPEALEDTKPQRLALYEYTIALIRAFANLANDMREAGYTDADITAIRREVDHYDTVRTEIKMASGDYIDLKQYEPGMRQLMDMYIRADESRKISTWENMTLIDLIVERGVAAIDALPEGIASNSDAVAETIENNVRTLIVEENTRNPVYYGRMSELLDALIEERRTKAIEYEAYLAQIVELTRQVKQPETSANYPKAINTPAKQAIYDQLDDETLAVQIDKAVQQTKKHNWRGNPAKEQEIKAAIYAQVQDEQLTENLFVLISNQSEY